MADESSPTYSPDHFPSSPTENPVEIAKKLGKTNMLQWMEIRVCEPEKRTSTSMKMQDTYMVYLIETRITDNSVKCKGDGTTSLWRRYSEFELLRNYLDITYPALVIPPLPEKKATYTWQNMATDKFDVEFIERRRAALEIFLLRCAAHPIVCCDTIFIGFLQKNEGWKDSVYATDFQNKADSKLKSLNASFRLKKPDQQFEEVKNYSNEIESNIGNLLKVRARMADHQFGIHKLHGNYQRAIDAILEEEEQYADQLKEYLAFGDSLRSACRKYECLQYDLERADESLSSKTAQKQMLSQGKAPTGFSLGSLKKAVFGNDTPEQRELKIKHLDEQIKLTEVELKQINEETQEHSNAIVSSLLNEV
ncbi:SNX4-like protein [Mya arenaria]|uniref:SNX4-like protein n=1 Tax=Mya arenaria TaxID=6604 RepID=A0ABY7E3V5_MYAAR|nr:SNX4-like protein [Mya arenaria]